MKRITMTLEESTAAWVRAQAAKRGRSVSSFLREILEQEMRGEREYFEAMRRFQALKPRYFEWVDGKRPTREELNVRPRYR